MLVKLLVDVRYPCRWVINVPAYSAGSVVEAVPARNLPNYKEKGLLWIDTPELRDDPYGILLEKGDYTIIER